MHWQQTYAAFLKHGGDYTEDEVTNYVDRATLIVNNIPEPYRSNLTRQLRAVSRDDFIDVNFDVLESIFTGKNLYEE